MDCVDKIKKGGEPPDDPDKIISMRVMKDMQVNASSTNRNDEKGGCFELIPKIPFHRLDEGRVVIDLRPIWRPSHVARIKELAREGFYDGTSSTG